MRLRSFSLRNSACLLALAAILTAPPPRTFAAEGDAVDLRVDHRYTIPAGEALTFIDLDAQRIVTPTFELQRVEPDRPLTAENLKVTRELRTWAAEQGADVAASLVTGVLDVLKLDNTRIFVEPWQARDMAQLAELLYQPNPTSGRPMELWQVTQGETESIAYRTATDTIGLLRATVEAEQATISQQVAPLAPPLVLQGKRIAIVNMPYEWDSPMTSWLKRELKMRGATLGTLTFGDDLPAGIDGIAEAGQAISKPTMPPEGLGRGRRLQSNMPAPGTPEHDQWAQHLQWTHNVRTQAEAKGLIVLRSLTWHEPIAFSLPSRDRTRFMLRRPVTMGTGETGSRLDSRLRWIALATNVPMIVEWEVLRKIDVEANDHIGGIRGSPPAAALLDVTLHNAARESSAPLGYYIDDRGRIVVTSREAIREQGREGEPELVPIRPGVKK